MICSYHYIMYKLNKVKLKKNFTYLEKLCPTKNRHIEREM